MMQRIKNKDYSIPMAFARLSSVLVLIVGLAWDCVCPKSGLAQPPQPSVEKPGEVTVESIEANINKVERSKEIADATKASILALYQEAMQDVIRATTLRDKSRIFEQDKASAAKDIERAKAALAENPQGAPVHAPLNASVKHLERVLVEAKAKLSSANEKLAAAEAEPRRRANRRLEVERLLKEARSRTAKLDRQRAAMSASDDKSSGPLELAQKLALQAALRTAQLEIDGYSKELAAHGATIDLLPLNHDLATREVSMAKGVVNELSKRISEARLKEAEEQIRTATQKAAMADPSLKEIAEDNKTLAGERQELIEKCKNSAERLNRRRKELTKIEKEYEGVQDKLKSVGRTKAISSFLKMQQATLPDIHDYRESIETRHPETIDTQTRIIELAKKRAELAEEDESLDAVQEDPEDEPVLSEDEQQLSQAKQELLQTQKRYVDQLAGEYYRYFNTLVELDTTEQELIDKVDVYNNFIAEQVLWIRSTFPIWETANWEKSLDARRVLDARIWNESFRTLTRDVKSNPMLWFGILLVLMLLVYSRRRIKPALRELGTRAEAGCMQQFLPTAQAVLLTALLTIPTAGILAFLSWRISEGIGVSESARAISTGLLTTVLVFLPLEFFRRTCGSHGLAESHFGWPSSAVARTRHLLLRLILLTFPFVLVSATLIGMQSVDLNDTIGRLCFIASLCILALMMHLLLRRRGQVFLAFYAAQSDKWISRPFVVGYVLMVVVPLLLMLFAAFGYYVTAWHLASRWLETVVLMLSLLLLGAFCLRWILVVRRRLAIYRARQQREEMQAAAAAAAGMEEGEAADTQANPVPDAGPDLATINMQSRRLLFVVLGFVAALGLWLIWDDVFPALGILKYVPLPGSTTVTLADLAGAMVIAGLTSVAARNIPGLLEMLLLHHLPIDKGLRYAITTVCRYILITVGVIWACNHVGMSWSKVQWILAAMSVGLGFGLQEIFANFVSGMVILFERPIRIGDIITIGDATGKVSKIQMRATTITDWDKKELVVPNKEFATGRILNWTLTNTVNRIIITVGVSYRSDPDQVREVLLQCAAEHPKVVDEPKPVCMFREFGSSALMFSLRIYLASMKGRLDVIHEMHSAVHRTLREAGIEIAYPQLDLHVRSGLKDDIIEVE